MFNFLIGLFIIACIGGLVSWWIDYTLGEVISWMVVFLVGLTIMVMSPVDAHADLFPSKPTVVKDSGNVVVATHVGNRGGDVRAAASYVDGLTNTRVVYGPCKANIRCITINLGTVPGSATGRTTGTAYRTVITIEPGVSNSYDRRFLLIHEFGHAFGLGHNVRCVSFMYAYRACNGHHTPWVFTAAERTTLGRH